MEKSFGSVKAVVDLNAADEEGIFMDVRLSRTPDEARTETSCEFERNLYRAVRWILELEHVVKEKGHCARLESLLREMGDDHRAAGITSD